MLERFPDIPSLLVARARSHGDRPALETTCGDRLTYGRLTSVVAGIAAGLRAAGIPSRRARPRIAIVMPNGLELAVALLGATAAGEAAPFNPASTAAELDVYFRDTGVDAVLLRADDNGLAVAVAEATRLPILRLTPRFEIAGFESHDAPMPAARPGDVSLVLLTSGSTGRPKIVPLTHGNVCVSAGDVARSMGLTEVDRCLTMWEQYHIGGLVDLLLAPLASGGAVILTAGFDAERFYELLPAVKPTWFQAVPTTLNELVLRAQRGGISPRPHTLRLVRSVAAALPPSLMEEVERLFGVPVIQTFGMTEAGPLIASTGLPPARRVPGSVGVSCGPEIRIAPGPTTSADGHPLGEVAIRGPNVFSGYENDDEANRAAFRDGWFFTGDTGYLDDSGNLFLAGRLKQLINRGGEKVNPQEVDDALLCHPAVAEAATVAVRHPRLGEDVAAVVSLKAATTADELRGFLATRLAAFKIPGQILVLDRLPRNPVGKLDKLAIAGLLEASRATAGHAAARNELESLLAGIWAEELGIPAVGIHDDFAVLGGDSLSSVRILVAVESRLDGPIPERVFAHASTVAKIAEALTKAGLKVRPAAAGAPAIAAMLTTTRIGTEDLAGAPEAAVARLEAAATTADLTAVQDAMTLYATPAEVRRLLEATRRAAPGRAAARAGWWARFGLRREHAAWRRSVRREISASLENLAWQREAIAPAAFHYAAVRAPGCQDPVPKTLLVGFGGNYLRLMVPTYRILANLDPANIDLLLLTDETRRLFLNGVAGLAAGLDDLCDAVSEFASRRGYGRIVSLGTSGGGPAAIYAAVRQGWARATAVGPGSPARHPEMARALESVVNLQAERMIEIVVATSANGRDTDAAHQLRNLFPGIVLHRDLRFSTHNLLHELHRTGELGGFLAAALAPSSTGEHDRQRAA